MHSRRRLRVVAGTQHQRRADRLSDLEEDRVRTRENLLGAMVAAVLVVLGVWIADEFAEANCYQPVSECRAGGMPPIALLKDTLR